MVKFYKLARYAGDDGKSKVGFLREDGIFLPNNYALELVIYRAENGKGEKTWYVVECSSGSGLGEGKTKNAAIQAFENNVQRLGIKGITKAVNRSIELYGRTPDHRETEVF